MSIQKLPSGMWRAQVYNPRTGGNVSVGKVLDGPSTFKTRREAKAAREKARTKLSAAGGTFGTTIAAFRDRWTTDPLFARPKESTNIHNAERTKAFCDQYGHIAPDAVGDLVVAQWLAGGARSSQVPALRAMWNDMMSAKAGRTATKNPWAGLGISRSSGNRKRQPPTQAQAEQLIQIARDLTPPSFAGYLEFAGVTAIRPGELDALQHAHVRTEDREIDVLVQWNAKTRTFTAPKYGAYTVALVDRARQILEDMPRDHADSPYLFTTIRGTHYTPSARTHHWNRVRAGAGLGNMSLYLATRHYFGWYAINVLELPPHVVAEQLGHRDGGKLVATLYGHPDAKVSRRRIREAHDGHGQVVELDSKRRKGIA